MKNLFLKLLFCLCLLSLGTSAKNLKAEGSDSSSVLYRIVFTVEENQPQTTLIVEERHQNGSKTVLATQNLPCDIIGDVAFEENKAIFSGGYLACTHGDINKLLPEDAQPLPAQLDVDGIYFDSKTTVSTIGVQQTDYPIMSYDSMKFGVYTPDGEFAQTKLAIGTENHSSVEYLLDNMWQTEVHQACDHSCQFTFNLNGNVGEDRNMGQSQAQPTYNINTEAQTFYIGYDPSNPDIYFHGEIEFLEWDPSLCRCLS